MSRETQKDLTNLIAFINDYKLSHLLPHDLFKAFISQQHKKYFSYLTFIADLQNFINDSSFNSLINEKQFSFIKESCSDVGIAFFSTFHGSYKSSKLLLRSSIETFLKGYCLDELPNIDTETSMFALFANVKALNTFQTEPSKKIINLIHQKYKLLCADVHTATNLNMANISALNYFPTYDNSDAQKISSFCLSLIPCYLTLMCLKYNNQYHRFHYKNKEIIIKSIPKEYRPAIHNIE